MGKVNYGAVDKDNHPTMLSRSVKANGFIYTAGITARDAQGKIPTGMEAQTRTVMERLSNVLAEAGASLRDVIKVNISMVDLTDLETMNRVYKSYFPKDAPARAMVKVAGLADPAYLLEIEMIAVDPGATR